MQDSATLGVSLVILGPPWGPLWPWEFNVPILDLDEEGKKKTLLYMEDTGRVMF